MSNVTNFDKPAIDEDAVLMGYVLGHLSPGETAAFETRMAGDPALRARVAEEQELAALVQGEPPSAEIPAEAFNAVAREIEADAKRTPWWGAVAAVVTGLGVLLIFTATNTDAPEPAFETLSSESVTRVESPLQYRVVLSAPLDDAGRAELAAERGFEFVGEPSETGAWTVVTPAPVADEVLAGWREDPRILLAEPVRYEASP